MFASSIWTASPPLGKTKTQEGRMNRIGRLAIFAVLLIVALLIIWQVFGAAWG